MNARRVTTLFALLLLGACSSAHTAATPRTALSRYNNQGVAFAYPQGWNVTTPTCVTPHPAGGREPIVYLTARLRDGRAGGGCGAPIGTLQPRGVYVSWWVQHPVGSGAYALTPPVTTLRVDGFYATMTERTTCPVREFGPLASPVTRAQYRAISVVASVGTYLYGFDACLRGPDLNTSTAQIRGMLASVKLQVPVPALR